MDSHQRYCFGSTKPWSSQQCSTVYLSGGGHSKRLLLLERVQRATNIGAPVALRITPAIALYDILHTAPVDRCPGVLLRSKTGGVRTRIRRSSLLLHCVADGFFHAYILTRDMWMGRNCWRRGAVRSLTDGPKLRRTVESIKLLYHQTGLCP